MLLLFCLQSRSNGYVLNLIVEAKRSFDLQFVGGEEADLVKTKRSNCLVKHDELFPR